MLRNRISSNLFIKGGFMPITPIQLAENRDSLKKHPSVETAINVLVSAAEFQPLPRGQIKFDRKPGAGTKGELWLRNSLVWLRTIPLQCGHYFVNLHAESPIYLNPTGGRSFSTDLLGLSYKNNGAKLCAVELKSGVGGDNLIYAITEGAINLIFSCKNAPQLINHWKDHKEIRTIWRKANPFTRLKKAELVILGDYAWFDANKSLKASALQLKTTIKARFGIDTYVCYFDKGVQTNSSPYRLLNINRFI